VISRFINHYVHKPNDKIIETGNRLQSLFSDDFVQIPCTQEKPVSCSFHADKHHFKRMSVVFPHPAFWIKKEESLD